MPCPWGPIAAPKVLLKPLPPGESEVGRPEHSAQSLCPQDSRRVRGQVCGQYLSPGPQAAVQILALPPPYWGPQGHCLQHKSQCHKEVAHRLRFLCYPMLPSYSKVEKRLFRRKRSHHHPLNAFCAQAHHTHGLTNPPGVLLGGETEAQRGGVCPTSQG